MGSGRFCSFRVPWGFVECEKSARPPPRRYGNGEACRNLRPDACGLAVRDPARSLAFYQAVLGVVAVYQDASMVQAQTPGSRDVLVFERAPKRAGRAGGVAHLGFRLTRAADIAKAVAAVRAPADRS